MQKRSEFAKMWYGVEKLYLRLCEEVIGRALRWAALNSEGRLVTPFVDSLHFVDHALAGLSPISHLCSLLFLLLKAQFFRLALAGY